MPADYCIPLQDLSIPYGLMKPYPQGVGDNGLDFLGSFPFGIHTEQNRRRTYIIVLLLNVPQFSALQQVAV